jgi:hypothetical protein
MRKMRSATIHPDERTFEEVERRAQVRRRPVSNLLRCLVENAITGRETRETAGSGMVAA